MIDLRKRELPSGIEFEGVFYELDTDFRTWIAFGHDLRVNHVASSYVFKGKLPPSAEALPALLEFFMCESVTPRHKEGQSNDRVLDLVLDGEYIVASFQHAYGIDLTSIEYMHWHRFKALLNGLPDSTILSHAMAYRSYKKDSREYDAIMREKKALWRLPRDGEDEQQRKLLEWAEGLGL